MNLDRDLIGAPEFLREKNLETVEVTSFRHALKLIGAEDFGAILIDDNGDPEAVDFIVDARRIRPHLSVFVVSARC